MNDDFNWRQLDLLNPDKKAHYILLVLLFFVGGSLPTVQNEILAGLGTVCALLWLVGTIRLIVHKVRSRSKPQQFINYERIPTLAEVMADEIFNGILPVVADSPMLREGETTHFMCVAERTITKNRVVGRTGGSFGVSTRIGRGASIRTTSFSSQPVYGDVVGKHLGTFILTDKRIVFQHSQHGFETTISTIATISEGEDSDVVIQKGSTSYVLKLVAEVDNRTRTFMVLLNPADLLVQAISLIRDKGKEPEASVPAQLQDASRPLAARCTKCATEVIGEFCHSCGERAVR